MKVKTKGEVAVTTIEDGIRKNNKIMTKFMVFLVVFSLACMLAFGVLALSVKNNADIAIGVERANGMQSEWCDEVILATLEGSNPDVESDGTKCEFAKWKDSFDAASIGDSAVK